jgi:hypothetical protein
VEFFSNDFQPFSVFITFYNFFSTHNAENGGTGNSSGKGEEAMTARYFLKRGKSVKGPFSLRKLQQLLNANKLRKSDLVSDSRNGPWGQKLPDVETQGVAASEATAAPQQSRGGESTEHTSENASGSCGNGQKKPIARRPVLKRIMPQLLQILRMPLLQILRMPLRLIRSEKAGSENTESQTTAELPARWAGVCAKCKHLSHIQKLDHCKHCLGFNWRRDETRGGAAALQCETCNRGFESDFLCLNCRHYNPFLPTAATNLVLIPRGYTIKEYFDDREHKFDVLFKFAIVILIIFFLMAVYSLLVTDFTRI